MQRHINKNNIIILIILIELSIITQITVGSGNRPAPQRHPTKFKVQHLKQGTSLILTPRIKIKTKVDY